nr:RNA-directed DNA polymerase, eukaryota [Tanacetum cinerariifolium]
MRTPIASRASTCIRYYFSFSTSYAFLLRVVTCSEEVMGPITPTGIAVDPDKSAKRQPTLSCSSAKAEYRGIANAVAETSWLRNLLHELHTPISSDMLVYCDNGLSLDLDRPHSFVMLREISKKDDVQKISTSVFVRNFLGKRFGFMRFIKVLDIDRLINNLCTVWVGRKKIHANVARFQREQRHKQSNNVNNKGTNNFNHGAKGMTNSYVHVVKGNQVQNVGKEGYVNIKLKYMGGFWVMIVFQDDETKKSFNLTWRWGTLLSGDELEDEGYHSNRIYIRTKLKTVMFDYFKMVYRGMTCWVHAIEKPGWVPDFEEDGEEGYDVNDGSHEDDMYRGVSENLKDVEGRMMFILRIRFGIYEVLNKKRYGKNIDDKHEDSLKYPHVFTLNEEGDVLVEKVDNWSDDNRVNEGKKDRVCEGQHVRERVEVSNDTHESTCSGHFKKSEVPHKGGSILELVDDLINNWDGEVVIMGYFNELCDISERFGLLFNKHGAEAFNSFIVNAGLVEVSLGGCSFMWCHKSAKKMSKLDRFLIFDNLMCSSPSISYMSLDRFLSDHRPIIMHDAHYDYGPIPFNFFNYWFKLDGFDKLVEQTWLEANVNDQNSYSKFMNKLKYLKKKIRIWTRLHNESLNSRKSILKALTLMGLLIKERVQMLMGIGGQKLFGDSRGGEGRCLTRRLKGQFRIVVLIKHPGRIVLHLVSIDGIGILLVTMLLMLSNDFFCMERSRKEVNGNNIDTIIRVLDVFYRTLSLRINLNKSNLMGIFMDSNKVKRAAAKIDVNSKKPSWVRWKSVLAAKDVGGLGESSLFALN